MQLNELLSYVRKQGDDNAIKSDASDFGSGVHYGRTQAYDDVEESLSKINSWNDISDETNPPSGVDVLITDGEGNFVIGQHTKFGYWIAKPNLTKDSCNSIGLDESKVKYWSEIPMDGKKWQI